MFKTNHIWITVGILAFTVLAKSSPVDENEIKKVRECKTFCDSCHCIGFYCGEECICECNDERNDDTECIASIQDNARKKKIPFEILIQGKSSNKFLKSALQFDQNTQQCNKRESGRSKRSTVVIYKPAVENTLDPNGYCEKPLKKDEKQQLFRGKRAIDGESWFTDFSNTLVKPAPIPGKSVDIQESEEETEVQKKPAKIATTESSVEDLDLIPKIRGRIKNVLNLGEREDLVKDIRKTVKRIESKTLKAVELEGTAKKIRGAITNLRNKAEDILLPSDTRDNSRLEQRASRRILNNLRSRISKTFRDYNADENSSL